MKASALKYAILSTAASLILVILALMPFHAFLTVWASSQFGHYVLLRLWKEILLVLIGLLAVFLLAKDHKIRSHTLTRRLVWLIAGYLSFQLAVGAFAYSRQAVTLEALGYGLAVNLRFLAFFLACWVIALRTVKLRTYWTRALLWPAVVVVAFGILQIFVLPNDFLRHFGYGPGTIEPFETINNNPEFVRISSTLRGPNPLGAYLIVPITTLAVLLLANRRNWKLWVFLAATLVVLVFSFSRSAWIGVILSLVVVTAASLRAHLSKRQLIYAASALVLIVSIGTATMRNNARFENVFFHTQSRTTAVTSSNDERLGALTGGLKDIARYPLGEGPGTAGPASVYNDGSVEISENYFIQIGQEVGVVGIAMFITINAGVGYLLFIRRSDPLALSLLASLIGISVVSLLSHAWADDTLAYVWWGLAGIAMVDPPPKRPSISGKK